jgi:predicted nucleic acid-binding protein
LDTSALVKLYVDEEGSPMVRQWVEDADTVATSILAFVEARAAFARRHREKSISSKVHARLIRDFAVDWDRYLVLEATQTLIIRAARLTETHALRAYDAIHLAAAIMLRERLAETVTFISWDARLVLAARKQGLDAVPFN